MPPPAISGTSGEFLAKNGLSTFVCSETQKFGHVTFFWNGNRSGYFDEKLETYVEVRAWGCRVGAGGWMGSVRGELGGRGRCLAPFCLPACGNVAFEHPLMLLSVLMPLYCTDCCLYRLCIAAPVPHHPRTKHPHPGLYRTASQIPSDTVPFNEIPEMKAREICEAGKEALRSGGCWVLVSAGRAAGKRVELRWVLGGAPPAACL